MPLYIAQSGDLDRCYHNAFQTRSLPTLKDRATQLLIKYKSGALVTQFIFTALLLRENHNFPSSGFQNKTSFLFETRQPRTHVRVLG